MQEAIGAGSITAAMILSLVALTLIWNLIKSYSARRRLARLRALKTSWRQAR